MDRREQTAWGRLLELAPRGRYEHLKSWEKRNRRRRNFVRRLDRKPDGCWVWTGQRAKRAQNDYPAITIRDNGKHWQRSAFAWMTEEFFPEITLPHRTFATCGNSMCVSPLHRANAMVTNNILTADEALQVYQCKGKLKSHEVAQKFGISANQVLCIWRGRNWSEVTGHPKPQGPTRPKRTPDDVRKQILECQGNASSREVAARFGVSHRTVSRIWANPGLSQTQTP